MTVAAGSPISSYIGNGSANTFAFSFPVFTASQLLVKVAIASGLTTLVLNTDYTVSGLNPTGRPASTGSITLISSGQAWLSGGNLASGNTLSIQANFPLAQSTSIRDQGDFDRSALEDALDNIVYQIQQLQLEIANLQAGGSVLTQSTMLIDTITGKNWQLQVVNGQLTLLELT
jgi:hypothetical protein